MPEPTGWAGATRPDRIPDAAKSRLVPWFLATPAGACGTLPPDWGKARPPGIGRSWRETGVWLSAPPRTRYTAPRAAPVRNEHRRAARYRYAAECFPGPIRTS